jgi:hypothetical protein
MPLPTERAPTAQEYEQAKWDELVYPGGAPLEAIRRFTVSTDRYSKVLIFIGIVQAVLAGIQIYLLVVHR